MRHRGRSLRRGGQTPDNATEHEDARQAAQPTHERGGIPPTATRARGRSYKLQLSCVFAFVHWPADSPLDYGPPYAREISTRSLSGCSSSAWAASGFARALPLEQRELRARG